ncbi:MAG: reverse transcriptase domain-containing protein [Cellulosilyticaceae bacterium]
MDELFSEKNLFEYYMENLRRKCTVGTDKIGRIKFENHLPSTIKLINNKVLEGKYKFTSYKGTLVHKGIGKPPRVIAMATIRDKLVLMILKEYLAKQYIGSNIPLVQTVIQNIKNEIDNFDGYIKIDIKDFYGSIDQKVLLDKISKIDIKAQRLIKRCIQNEIICHPFGEMKLNDTGIPQGLPISNILAEIYISEIDEGYKVNPNYKYYRYVDDIFILCKKRDGKKIQEEITNQLKDKLGLDVNEEKSYSRGINETTNYLGYKISKKKFSVQEKSIKRVEKVLEKLFLEYKHNKNYTKEMLIWDINLKITGCKFDQGKYGWIFFYSQIDDKKVLFHLDNLVSKLLKRYELEELKTNKEIKRFARTYHEVIYNLNATKYIPHFSRYNIEDQKDILKNIFNEDIEKMTDEDIQDRFNLNIYKKVRDLEKDIQTIS